MPIQLHRTTLPNGIQIVGEVDRSAHTASVGFFFRTGARDEEPRLMGVSHFLEHMMFKGTATRSAVAVNRDLDAIGASANAYTTSELTSYYAHVLPEHVGALVDILSDILRPALREADFDEERGVILEEIAMYADQPFFVLYERAIELFYGAHPLAHRVLGTNETIERLSRDEMMAYFRSRYSADNTVVAVAGNVDFDAIVHDIGSRCARWESTRPARTLAPWTSCDRDESISLANATRHYMILIAPAPDINHDDRYAAAMLAHVLGDADGSRLHWALIETGIAEEASAQYEGRDGVGELLVSAVCDPEHAEEVRATIEREIESLALSVTEDDLLRNRSKIATAVTLAGERPAGRMNRLGTILSYRGEYLPLEEELRRIESVTVDDLREYARRWPPRPRVVAQLSPPA